MNNYNKLKILNLLLIITSLLGYLEWNGGNHLFLLEAEAEIFSKLFSNPLSVIHPFTILPIISQAILFYTLFQRKPSFILAYCSIIGLGLLLAFMFVIGIMSFNYKIFLSTIPFLLVATLTIIHLRKLKKTI